MADGLSMKIIDRPSELAQYAVGDTGIEPVTVSDQVIPPA
jgi:hypothetical protein